MSYKPLRWTPRLDGRPRSAHYVSHRQTRQGDEMACACGKRWPVGEDHP